MQHPDEGTIHAWLDGALSTEESGTLETHVATCAECAATVAEARGLIAASSRIVSALDIVPGGVIPLQAPPVRLAWYSTTQFRAAAAVLFVAGASMILMQGRDGGGVEDLSQRVMSTPSPVATETSQAQSADAADERASMPAESDARAAEPARLPSRPQVAGPGSPEMRAQAQRETADGAANAATTLQAPAPVAAMPVAAMPLAKAAEGRAAGATAPALDNVAVTGAAAESDMASLRVAHRDSTPSTRTTLFVVDPGVTVSLTESFASVRAATRARQLLDAAPSAAAAAPPPPVNQNRASPLLSISWTDPLTRNVFTLSGPLPRERLEELRKQIEARERILRSKE